MIELLATLMINPLPLVRWQQALLLLPLCLCISIIYKTIKCENLREIPMAVLKNWITIVIGMYVVGIALLLIYELLA
ncbi:MAG TPA: hypothetical protein PLL20_20320 [Phycisphaerae bacterium]|nr:hypothetical protein [Phycisphaerae bacterium]HRR83770.1 hypothetical protein [Phycisphaerae bacterium]